MPCITLRRNLQDSERVSKSLALLETSSLSDASGANLKKPAREMEGEEGEVGSLALPRNTTVSAAQKAGTSVR